MFGTKFAKLGRRLSGATLGMAMAIGVATTPASAAAAWQYHYLDADRYADAATMDADGNGNPEQIWFDLDDDGRWDTHIYNNRGGDALLEVLTFDRDEDRTVEYMVVDTNQREGFELAYINLNDDNAWDGVVAVNSTSALNQSAQRYINNYTGSTLVQIFRMY